jgi:hypothetical protein
MEADVVKAIKALGRYIDNEGAGAEWLIVPEDRITIKCALTRIVDKLREDEGTGA